MGADLLSHLFQFFWRLWFFLLFPFFFLFFSLNWISFFHFSFPFSFSNLLAIKSFFYDTFFTQEILAYIFSLSLFFFSLFLSAFLSLLISSLFHTICLFSYSSFYISSESLCLFLSLFYSCCPLSLFFLSISYPVEVAASFSFFSQTVFLPSLIAKSPSILFSQSSTKT